MNASTFYQLKPSFLRQFLHTLPDVLLTIIAQYGTPECWRFNDHNGTKLVGKNDYRIFAIDYSRKKHVINNTFAFGGKIYANLAHDEGCYLSELVVIYDPLMITIHESQPLMNIPFFKNFVVCNDILYFLSESHIENLRYTVMYSLTFNTKGKCLVTTYALSEGMNLRYFKQGGLYTTDNCVFFVGEGVNDCSFEIWMFQYHTLQFVKISSYSATDSPLQTCTAGHGKIHCFTNTRVITFDLKTKDWTHSITHSSWIFYFRSGDLAIVAPYDQNIIYFPTWTCQCDRIDCNYYDYTKQEWVVCPKRMFTCDDIVIR